MNRSKNDLKAALQPVATPASLTSPNPLNQNPLSSPTAVPRVGTRNSSPGILRKPGISNSKSSALKPIQRFKSSSRIH